MSGLLIGAVGPVISPGVALLNSALAVGAALQASDPSAALSDLLDVPANVVNSFFNGADLNLDALAPLIAQAGVLPAGTTIDALDYAFGGLFTVGSVSQGTYTQDGNIDPITTPGGSILNSLGLTVTTDALGVPLTLAIPSHAVGPLGALESISQTAGVLLGDHWDGKGAVQTPPLSGLQFPTLSDTAEDPAAVNAATNDTATVDALFPRRPRQRFSSSPRRSRKSRLRRMRRGRLSWLAYRSCMFPLRHRGQLPPARRAAAQRRQTPLQPEPAAQPFRSRAAAHPASTDREQSGPRRDLQRPCRHQRRKQQQH